MYLNYDIFFDILQCLDPYVDGCTLDSKSAKKVALARVACTCRALSDTALGILWKEVDSLGILLSILPSCKSCSEVRQHKLLYNRDDAEPFEWLLCGDISPSEFLRFKQYASRVRILSNMHPHVLSATAFGRLSRQNERLPLLPNLERLEYMGWAALDLSLFFLIAPSLCTLHIDVQRRGYFGRRSQSRMAGPILATVLHRTSSITSDYGPYLSSLGFAEDDFPGIKCDNLQEVTLKSWEPMLDSSVFRSLALVPNLTDLSLSLHTDDANVTDNFTFKSLRRLRLRGHTPLLADFIEAGAICAPRLRSLNLELTYSADRVPEQCHRCLSAVCAKYDESLRELRLTTAESGREMDNELPEQSMGNIIAPLLALRLEIVHILPPLRWFLTISDAFICDIAAAWPGLVEFVTTSYRLSVSPSISSLTELATCCPDLRKLALPSLDLRLLAPSTSPGPISMHHLRHLELGNDIHGLHLEYINYLLLAQFVHHTFPKLDLESSVFRAISFTGPNTYCPELMNALRNLQTGLQSL